MNEDSKLAAIRQKADEYTERLSVGPEERQRLRMAFIEGALEERLQWQPLVERIDRLEEDVAALPGRLPSRRGGPA